MKVRQSGASFNQVFVGLAFFIQMILLALTAINVQAIPPSAAVEVERFAELVHQGELAQAGAVKAGIEQKVFGSVKEKVGAQMEEAIQTKAEEETTLFLRKNADYKAVKRTLEELSRLGFAETVKQFAVKLDQVQAARKSLELERQAALNAAERVSYLGPVQHIFFHPLIAYPELAFDGDLEEKGYNDWFVTVPEFHKILESLYQKNYILIDIHALYEEKAENGKNVLTPKPLKLPQGKKPLILSVDDLNYYQYMLRNGNVYKLILDDTGNIVTYSVDPGGQEAVSKDNEIIPILDQFVREHPDFSLDGAKGVIALTGYEGVLGYRTNERESPRYAEERQQALSVIKRLKETGWSFASHGYGHLNARSISLSSLQGDTRRWLEEVEPLIGPTDVYIYPFGASVLPGDPKFQFLLNSGFRVLCSVGPNPYMKFGSDYLMMDRRHIDGIALHYQANSVKDLFDAEKVIDSIRPPFRP
ncbi:hypothetical protein JCM15765_17180 [Paradesulfitobacterium aromaticivorans]